MFAEQLLFINRADLLRHPVTELSINIVPNRIFSSAILLWSFELWSKHVWQKRAPDRYLPYKQTGYHSISSISCVSLILFYLRRFYQTFFELLYAFLIARTLLLNHSHLITLIFRHRSSKDNIPSVFECIWSLFDEELRCVETALLDVLLEDDGGETTTSFILVYEGTDVLAPGTFPTCFFTIRWRVRFKGTDFCLPKQI